MSGHVAREDLQVLRGWLLLLTAAAALRTTLAPLTAALRRLDANGERAVVLLDDARPFRRGDGLGRFGADRFSAVRRRRFLRARELLVGGHGEALAPSRVLEDDVAALGDPDDPQRPHPHLPTHGTPRPGDGRCRTETCHGGAPGR